MLLKAARTANWLKIVSVAVLAVGLLTAAAPAHPDFTGRYFTRPGFGQQGKRDASLNLMGGNARAWQTPPALNGGYAKTYAKILQSRLDGKPLADTSARCLPGFALGAFGNPYPVELVQKPAMLLVMFEGTDRIRRIYIGGRHPAKFPSQFYGHSVGHWEGRTLVVDTVGFRADTMIADGAPHSDRLHTTERLSFTNGGKTLQWDMQLADAEALKAPFVMRYDLDADPTIRMMEYSCQQNNRNVVNDRDETLSPG